MHTTHHPVAVVGAGLGGLTLARVLHVGGVEAAVFDRDAERHARTQGGMLDIHAESGQAALRAAGLYDAFLRLVLSGGQAVRVLDRHARVHLAVSDEESSGGRPEVDRGHLRDLLLDSLPGSTVRWGARVTATRTLADGRHQLTFADGSVHTADLLVGADGGWSRVRPLVSDAVPEHTGVVAVEVELRDADTRHPECAAVVGGGMLFALGDGKGLLGHRESDGSLGLHAVVPAPPTWPAGADASDAGAVPSGAATGAVTPGATGAVTPATDAVRKAVLERFHDWHPSLRALVADADGPFVPRPIFALPVGHRWPRVPGVTLIGDAAHLMSPFAGEGANSAMQDAADLARLLLAHPGDAETALAAYERTMFPRAESAAAESAAGLSLCFADDAPAGLVARFAGHRRRTG